MLPVPHASSAQKILFLALSDRYLPRSSVVDPVGFYSMDIGYNVRKGSIKEKEAQTLARVRSMVVEELPHPPLSNLAPPTPDMLIHVQVSGKTTH